MFKSRAGKSLEHHVEHLLREEGIPFASKPTAVEGEPDILIPSVEAYLNPKYPLDRLCMIGVKTTCKDRWRQVLNEAQRMKRRHILTIQPGISSNQMEEMRKAGVSLIVPKRLHKDYPPDRKLQIYDMANFLKYAKTIVA
jgi:type II restriction enzyme